MDHSAFAELENIPPPDSPSLLAEVTVLNPGQQQATEFEVAIEKLLSALLYPSLSSPAKQDKIHEGRKRVDITYINSTKDGFFEWVPSI